MPIKTNPNGIDWYRKRDVQIKAKLSQINKMKLKLFDKNGNPTKIHLNLIMWAYSPSKKFKNNYIIYNIYYIMPEGPEINYNQIF